MPPRLTPRRTDILRTLAQLQRELGRPVSVAELAAALTMTKQSLTEHLTVLEDFGLVTRGRGRYGLLTLTEEGQSHLGQRAGYPVVGEIAAGAPVLAEQVGEVRMTTLDDVLDLREGDFLLRVRGDSMSGIGILDGDLIAVRPCEECLPGEIAAVLLPNDNVATLKRFYREGDQVILVSENPEFAPMTFTAEEVRVQGCLVGHIAKPRPRKAFRGN